VLINRWFGLRNKQRYDGTFFGTLVDGAGVTAQLLMENGFRCVDVEDLVELCDGVNVMRNQKTEKLERC